MVGVNTLRVKILNRSCGQLLQTNGKHLKHVDNHIGYAFKACGFSKAELFTLPFLSASWFLTFIPTFATNFLTIENWSLLLSWPWVS